MASKHIVQGSARTCFEEQMQGSIDLLFALWIKAADLSNLVEAGVLWCWICSVEFFNPPHL